jgi:hypothetical protein
MNRFVAAASALLVLSGLPAMAGHAPLPGQNPPFAGGNQTKDPDVETLVVAAQKVEKQAKAKPKDAKLQKQTGAAYYQAGHAMMTSQKLVSKVKYPGALKLFRTALKYDPKHPAATEEKNMIESIYKDMLKRGQIKKMP